MTRRHWEANFRGGKIDVNMDADVHNGTAQQTEQMVSSGLRRNDTV